MAQQEATLCAFSPDARFFAAVTADNRLKVWDTGSGKLEHQFTRASHLTSAFTCLSWVPGKAKDKKKASACAVLALGTQEGEILCWDMRKEEVTQSLPNAKTKKKSGMAVSGAVSDVVFANSQTAYSCSTVNPHVLCWQVTDGSLSSKFKADARGVTRLALTADASRLITAGSSHVKVWDLSSGQAIAQLAGHSSTVQSLLVLPSQLQFLSAGEAPDRTVNLWRLGEADADASSPQQSFVGRAAPHALASNLHLAIGEKAGVRKAVKRSKGSDGKAQAKAVVENDADISHVHFLAVLRKEVAVWAVEAQRLSKKPSKPSGVVRLPAQEAKDKATSFLAAAFCDANRIIAARGSLAKPRFDRLKYLQDGQVVKEMALKELCDSSILADGSSKKEKHEKDEVQVLSATDIGMKANGKMEMPQMKRGTQPEAGNTFEERLQQLQDQQAAVRKTVRDVTAKRSRKHATPSASSILAMLTQALQSKDTQLLETCLAVADRHVINNTVQRLANSKVPVFLEVLVEKFQTKPSRAAQLVPWLKALLSHHMAYLMTVPDLAILGNLYQAVNAHLAGFDQLMGLSGRLDLLLVQIESTKEASARSNSAATLTMSARDVMDEDEESEEESEEESGSDESDNDASMEDDFDMGDASDESV